MTGTPTAATAARSRGRTRPATPGAGQRWTAAPLRRVGQQTGPLFILGAPRSSQTLLACALGQHPDLHALLDTSWLARLGPALDDVHTAANRLGERTAFAAVAATRGDLLAAVGQAVAALLADGLTPAGTWVSSGTVDDPEDVAWLLSLFPAARIVHLIRHPDAAVTSLAVRACGDGRYAVPSTGYRTWTASVTALLAAECAFGSERIVRVDVAELHADPVGTLTRCLEPLGLPYDRRCATALHAIDDGRLAAPAGGPATHGRSAALRLHAKVTAVDAAGCSQLGDPHTAAGLLARREDTVAPVRHRSDAAGDAHHRYQQLVSLAVPAGESIAVVSKGDPALLEVPGRRCWHLPRTADGRYTGYHPADSRAAIAHLRDAVRDGARWLVVPGASAWWLEHYRDFGEHLRTTARCAAYHEDLATVYALPAQRPVMCAAPHPRTDAP